MEENEEINYDENDYNDYEEYNIDIDQDKNEIINDSNKKEEIIKDYEIIEYSKIKTIRKEMILKFMESACINYDEAELILIHYNWNYDKLIDIWFDEIEKLKLKVI